MKHDNAQQRLWRIWAAPIGLAAVTVFGLLSALLGDHVPWKALAWACLLMPVITACWFSLRRRRS